MIEDGVQRRLSAIMAIDVVGYSRLMSEDEVGTLVAVRSHREALIEPKIAEHNGRVVKLMGDGILSEFPSVVDAVQCAVEIQHATEEHNAGVAANRRIQLRIGINLGDVIVEGDDIYGDGVNVAARLEGLAPPGGICVRRVVRNQVRDKLPYGFEDMGEVEVKNIARPVRVFKVLPEGAGSAASRRTTAQMLTSARLVALACTTLLVVIVVAGAVWWWQPWAPDRTPPPPEKPSIAVLPFTNMSGDPDQEYFADGITEDIITDLSRISGLFVIDRNSTVIYEDPAVNVQQVGRDLGVRYVLVGSVRRDGGQVRITAQLVDASRGGSLWADRYDGALADVFALQDRVTAKIVSALALRLTANEQAQQARKETQSVAAYDAFLRASRLLNERDWMERPDNDKARAWLETAIELDPNYAAAYASLGFTYWLEVRHRAWAGGAYEMKRARELAETAIRLGGPPRAYRLLARIYLFTPWAEERDYDKAVAAARTALSLNPNDADSLADLAEVLVFFGEPGEALALMKKAIRLNPNYPDWYRRVAGYGYLLSRQYAQAIEEFTPLFEKEGSISDSSLNWLLLAASLAHADRIDEAKAVMAPHLARYPSTTMRSLARRFKLFKRPEHLDIVLEGLRKTGLPE